MEVGCVIFGMTPKKNQKDMRGITVLKDGMRWRFGENSNRHSSRGIYGRHIFSTWHLSGSHKAHSTMLTTRTFFLLTGYVSWTWAEPNGAVCRDARAKSRPLKGGATVHGQLCSTLRGMFVQSFYFVTYYFLELNMMIFLKKIRRPIIAGWGRDMGTIIRPIRISIRIYG